MGANASADVTRAEAAAEEIARVLAATLDPPVLWTRLGEPEREDVRRGELPYSVYPIFAIGEAIGFSIWVDRTLAPGAPDVPILCAAFEAYDGMQPLLRSIATDLARPRQYGRRDSDRLNGYGGADVIELPDTGAVFVSRLMPSRDFQVRTAVDAFASFFNRWRDLIEGAFGPRSAGETVGVDSALNRLVGLAGELAVLRLPRWREAKWVGFENSVHDIEDGECFVEVKTSVGTGLAPALSRQQITCGDDPRFFFALVDLPREALAVLLDETAADQAVEPIVIAMEKKIRTYLRATGPKLTPGLMVALSVAARACRIGWYRLRRPDQWGDAMRVLEEFGPLLEFRQRCPRERWFESCEEPSR